MAITWQSGTQVFLADQGSTSISVARPDAGSADHIIILVATVKESAAVFDDPSGFTPIGEQTGGTGAAADDVGTTRLAAWYRILSAPEAGDITVSNDIGVSSAGGRARFAPTDGYVFTPPIFVSGDDAIHGTGVTPTGFGTWSSAVGPGDTLLAVWSTDTDELIDSLGNVTQTGITFSTVDSHIRSRSTTGFDCGVYMEEFPITAGSNTNAPAYINGTGIESCGAAMIIRLHEEAAPAGGGVYQRQVIVG